MELLKGNLINSYIPSVHLIQPFKNVICILLFSQITSDFNKEISFTSETVSQHLANFKKTSILAEENKANLNQKTKTTRARGFPAGCESLPAWQYVWSY